MSPRGIDATIRVVPDVKRHGTPLAGLIRQHDDVLKAVTALRQALAAATPSPADYNYVTGTDDAPLAIVWAREDWREMDGHVEAVEVWAGALLAYLKREPQP